MKINIFMEIVLYNSVKYGAKRRKKIFLCSNSQISDHRAIPNNFSCIDNILAKLNIRWFNFDFGAAIGIEVINKINDNFLYVSSV